MRWILWFIGVPLAALTGGVVGAAPVFVMGLSVNMVVIGPLTLLSGSLLATLCAGWTANLAASGDEARSRSRLPAVFGVALLASVVALVPGFAAAWMVNALDLQHPASSLLVYLPGGVVFALATAAAAWRLRAPVQGGAVGAALALAVCGAWVAFLAVVGGLAYLLGLAPPDFGVGVPISIIVGGGLALAVPGVVLAARGSGGLARDAGLSLGAIGMLPAVISASIYLGCSVALCGP